MADIRVHIDTLEYTREGLKTKEPISLQVGAHNKVVLVRPERQPAFAASYGCFASGSSFPGPAFLSLLLHEHRLGPTALSLDDALARGRIQLFAHTDSSGSDSANKALADQRAAAASALLRADLEAFLEIATAESWGTPLDQLMLRALGCDPGPIDGKHETLTEAATTRFQETYTAGEYHEAGDSLLHPSLDVDGKLGPVTFESLLDAYVHHFSPRVPASKLTQLTQHHANGCASFNPAQDDDSAASNRRISLVVHGSDPAYPEATPCTPGSADACPVVPANSTSSCLWYREHVRDTPIERAIHYSFLPSWLPLTNGKYMLSVLTTVAEGEEVVFEVFASEDRVTTPQRRPERIVDVWPSVEIPAVVERGVAQVVWDPPPSFAPGPDGRFAGAVPSFAASHDASRAVAHASFPAHVISILLDRPLNPELPTFEGRLVLSDSQGHEVSFTATDAAPYDDEHLAFRFEGALESETYTLVHHLDGLQPHILFKNVAFGELEAEAHEDDVDDGSEDEQSIDFEAFMQVPEISSETRDLLF